VPDGRLRRRLRKQNRLPTKNNVTRTRRRRKQEPDSPVNRVSEFRNQPIDAALSQPRHAPLRALPSPQTANTPYSESRVDAVQSSARLRQPVAGRDAATIVTDGDANLTAIPAQRHLDVSARHRDFAFPRRESGFFYGELVRSCRNSHRGRCAAHEIPVNLDIGATGSRGHLPIPPVAALSGDASLGPVVRSRGG